MMLKSFCKNFVTLKNDQMKKTFLLLLGTIFCFSVFSQDRLNKVSFNPVSLIAAGLNNFEYERGLAEGKLGLAFYYGKTGNAIRPLNGYRINMSEQSLAFNIYVKNISRPAFWFGPRISFISSDIVDEDDPSNYAYNIGTLGLGLGVGFQLVAGGFYLTPFINIGGAITNDLWGELDYKGNLEPTRFLFSYGLKMGIAF
jgi:hypothetical protein